MSEGFQPAFAVSPQPIEVLVGQCPDHGEFHFVGNMSRYCPVLIEKWGETRACGWCEPSTTPYTLELAHQGLRDALAQLKEHHV